MDQLNDDADDGAIQLFMRALDASYEIATLLADSGFSTIEEIAYVPEFELQEIEGLTHWDVSMLRQRARTFLLAEATKGRAGP